MAQILLQVAAVMVFVMTQTAFGKLTVPTEEIEEAALKQYQVTSSCPVHQFFSYNLKSCRNCSQFCIENQMEEGCERQCLSFFLQRQVEDLKDQNGKLEDTVKALKKDVEDGESSLNGWAIGISVVSFILAVTAIAKLMWRFSRRQTNVHRTPSHEPQENVELESQTLLSKTSPTDSTDSGINANQDDVIEDTDSVSVPPENDSKPENNGVEGAHSSTVQLENECKPLDPRNKCFNSTTDLPQGPEMVEIGVTDDRPTGKV